MSEVFMVCGSRDYQDREGVERWTRTLHSSSILIHGDCAGSPDTWAGIVAEKMGLVVGKFPYVSAAGMSGGHLRNRAMVRMADRIIFFWDGSSKGTGKTIAYAKELCKPHEVRVYP